MNLWKSRISSCHNNFKSILAHQLESRPDLSTEHRNALSADQMDHQIESAHKCTKKSFKKTLF